MMKNSFSSCFPHSFLFWSVEKLFFNSSWWDFTHRICIWGKVKTVWSSTVIIIITWIWIFPINTQRRAASEFSQHIYSALAFFPLPFTLHISRHRYTILDGILLTTIFNFTLHNQRLSACLASVLKANKTKNAWKKCLISRWILSRVFQF